MQHLVLLEEFRRRQAEDPREGRSEQRPAGGDEQEAKAREAQDEVRGRAAGRATFLASSVCCSPEVPAATKAEITIRQLAQISGSMPRRQLAPGQAMDHVFPVAGRISRAGTHSVERRVCLLSSWRFSNAQPVWIAVNNSSIR